MNAITDRALRLAACALVRRRFSGRADLERRAMRDDVALARLELALGLGTADAVEEAERVAGERRARREYPELATWLDSTTRAERVRAVLRGTAPAVAARGYDQTFVAMRQHGLARMLAPIEMSVRWERTERRQAGRDELAERRPGHMLRRWAVRVARQVISAAALRTATHGHEDVVLAVEVGQETASSSTVHVSPRKAGLPNAYAKKGFSVAQSEHRWSVSTEILSPEVRALNTAAPAGVVWLSRTVRVRQGRGTALVCETVRPARAQRAA